MTENIMQVAQGAFKVQRFPIAAGEKLRAWDAADEYLLNDIADKIKLLGKLPRILIVNDSFGALTVALSEFQPVILSDSFLAQEAIRANYALNQYPIEQVSLLNSLEIPTGIFDFIIIKAPKILAFLEDILIRLQAHCTAETQVIVGGMVKNMSPNTWKVLDKCVGETVPSKAVKKARLIYATVDTTRVALENPYPSFFALENTAYQICNHANVFSRQSLDIGTRFFLANLPEGEAYQQVVDLGCGNGVLGLMFAERNAQAQLTFVDESFMALASAKENFKQRVVNKEPVQFIAGDALSGFAGQSMDLILCNPPFHQQNTVGTHIALRMFKQAKQVLRKGGELWVVANRHLGYQKALKSHFSQVILVAENEKFVILKAIH